MDWYDRGWVSGYGRDYRRGFGGSFGREGHRGQPMWAYWPGPAYPSPYGAQRGGRPRRYDRGGYDRAVYDRAVYGRGYPGPAATDYDRGYARTPFVPESEYRAHPEFDRPRRVSSGRWSERGYTAIYGDIDDDEIRSTVEQNLQQDGWVSADSIQVSVEDQVVTLTGEVGDYLEARYAWDDAWETMGVRGVINNLTVRLDRSAGRNQELFTQAEAGETKKPLASKKKKQTPKK